MEKYLLTFPTTQYINQMQQDHVECGMFPHVKDSEAQQSHEETAKGSPTVTAAV